MIVRYEPKDKLDEAEQAWFDSNASTNVEAIREIDSEAAKYGLSRTREYWLQTFTLPDGEVVRRGFCYRPGPSNLAERVAKRRGADILGAPSDQLVRSIRDEE